MKAELARKASIELSFLESGELRAGRDFLSPGQKIYVSHLPRQSWAQTWETCAQVTGAGFDPVPHVPVRLLKSEQQLDEVLSALRGAGASELLLIAGDYERPKVLTIGCCRSCRAASCRPGIHANLDSGSPGRPPQGVRR